MKLIFGQSEDPNLEDLLGEHASRVINSLSLTAIIQGIPSPINSNLLKIDDNDICQ